MSSRVPNPAEPDCLVDKVHDVLDGAGIHKKHGGTHDHLLGKEGTIGTSGLTGSPATHQHQHGSGLTNTGTTGSDYTTTGGSGLTGQSDRSTGLPGVGVGTLGASADQLSTRDREMKNGGMTDAVLPETTAGVQTAGAKELAHERGELGGTSGIARQAGGAGGHW